MQSDTTQRRWTQRPEGSNWGDFGPDDQLGQLNLLTPTLVRQAATEIVTGERFCLSLPLDYPGGNPLNPHRFPPQLRSTKRKGKFAYNLAHCCEFPGVTDVVCDDYVVLHTQYSTQWDSFAHVGSMFDVDGSGEPKAVFYNGFAAGERYLPEGMADPGFYRPVPRGLEVKIEEKLQSLRKMNAQSRKS